MKMWLSNGLWCISCLLLLCTAWSGAAEPDPSTDPFYTNGNRRESRDADGRSTFYSWSNGVVSEIRTPVLTLRRIITANGMVASETDGRGNTTSFTYDGNLRLTNLTPPAGHVTTFTYPADSSSTRETRGSFYVYSYSDGFGRPTGTLDRAGLRTDIAYTAYGTTDWTDSDIGDITYFDPFERVESVVHPDGQDVLYTYHGTTVTVTNETSGSTVYTYALFGDPEDTMLLSVRDAAGQTTTYARHILGSLTQITQGSLLRAYTYSPKNWLDSETHPETGTISYTRDAVGNILRRQDAVSTRSYTYDSGHRLSSISAAGQTIRLTYDGANNRTSLDGPAATLQFTHDAANRLIQQQTTLAGRVTTTRYAYDGNDNLITLTYPTGLVVTSSYDAKNFLTAVSGFGGTVGACTYNRARLPIACTLGNGKRTKRTYTSRYFPQRLTTAGVLDLGYTYDARGNITTRTDYRNSAKTQTLTYDALDRLLTFRGAWGSGSVAYDAVGNRTRKTLGPSTATYTYSSNRLSALSGSAPESYTYYGDGMVCTRTKGGVTSTLTYNGFGNLTRAASPSTTLATLAYDGDGRRVQKTAGSTTTWYHHDPSGRVLAETDASGRVVAEYIYANGTLVAQRDASGQVSYVHPDVLGTPQALTNASGQVLWRAEYLPFGETHTVSPTPSQTKRFLGKTFDTELGLSDLGARLLASDLGRFLAPDPVRAVDPVSSQERSVVTRNPQRLQLYGYGLNNPYRYVDPDGEFAFVPIILAAWAVAEAALSAYDAYDTVRTVASPETSSAEKGVALGLFAIGALAPGGGYSQIDNVVKGAYQVAKEGGKHAGFLRNYVGKSVDELEKGITSIKRQITEHRDKIANPKKYIPNFGQLDPRQQEALINKKWPSDIQRQSEQLDILRGLRNDR